MRPPECPYCGREMKLEREGKQNLFLAKCSNPNEYICFHVELAYYPYWRMVKTK